MNGLFWLSVLFYGYPIFYIEKEGQESRPQEGFEWQATIF